MIYRPGYCRLACFLVLAVSGAPALAYEYVAVGNPSSVGGYAYGLNNSGQAATTSLTRSFLASGTGYASVSEILISDSATSTPGVVAQGINDAGEVVGRYRIQGNPANQTSGFLRRVDGTIEKYDYPGLGSTSISDINHLGAMVGETRSDLTVFGVIRGFLYEEGNYSEISFPGSVLTRAYGINNASAIVGQFQNEDAVSRPFLLQGDDYQELTPHGAPGGLQSALATGINNKGLIIGTYRDLSNVTKTWLRDLDGSYSYPELPGSGWGINDLRQISGSFLDVTNGNARTPFVASVPEPATYILGLLGLGVASLLRTRMHSGRRDRRSSAKENAL